MVEHIIDTPLGWFRVVGTESNIIASSWINEEEAIVGSSGIKIDWRAQVEKQIKEYFEGSRATFNLPIEPQGSEFQRSVWQQLSHIPKGQKQSYTAIANRLGGEAGRARAVGQAVGSNPCLLLIPCHRVVGADDSLTGYAAGLAHKVWLLKHEGANDTVQLSLFE